MKEYKNNNISTGHTLMSVIDPGLLEILSRMTASKPEDRITSEKLVESLEIFKRRKSKINKSHKIRNLSNSFYQAFVKSVGREKKSIKNIKSFYFKKSRFSICLPRSMIKEKKYFNNKNKNKQIKIFKEHDTVYDPKKVNFNEKKTAGTFTERKIESDKMSLVDGQLNFVCLKPKTVFDFKFNRSG